MIIYDRLNVIGSLDNLRRRSIRRSIKYFFLKLWMDENGADVTDYKGDITTNVRDYVKTWLMNPPTQFKEKIKEMLTNLNDYKLIGTEQSFLKYLSYQLDKAYLLKNIPYLQFNYSIDNIENIASEIHSEFVGNSTSDMVSLDENVNIIIDNISIDDTLYVLSDILLKRDILYSLYQVNSVSRSKIKIEDIYFIDYENNIVNNGFGTKGYFRYLLEGDWEKSSTNDAIRSANGRVKIYTSNIKMFDEGFYIKFINKPNSSQTATNPIIFSFPDQNGNSLFNIEMVDVSSGLLKVRINSTNSFINNQSTFNTNISLDRIDDKAFSIVWDDKLKIYFNDSLLCEFNIKWDKSFIDNKYIILNSLHSENIEINKCLNSTIKSVEIGYMTYDGETPLLTSNDNYNLIYKDIIFNFISTSAINDDKIIAYTDLFTLIGEDNIENTKMKIYNYISNTFYGMNLRYKDEVFDFASDIEKDLSYYIIDTLLNTTFDYSKSFYTNDMKYAELKGKFKEDLLNDIFFENINIGNETSSSLSTIFIVQRIDEIYNRYNKSFANEPEHFNNALQNIKNVYLSISKLNKANFNSLFIPEKLTEFFNEFCIYVLWYDWLSTDNPTRSAITEDTNGFVPSEKSTISYVKPLIEKCITNNFLSIDEFKPSKEEILNIYNVSNFDKSQPFEIQKLNLISNIRLRIESFKYVKFTLNGLTEYDQYELEFYKYVMRLYNNIDQSTINRVAKELNDFYNNL